MLLFQYTVEGDVVLYTSFLGQLQLLHTFQSKFLCEKHRAEESSSVHLFKYWTLLYGILLLLLRQHIYKMQCVFQFVISEVFSELFAVPPKDVSPFKLGLNGFSKINFVGLEKR